MPALAANGHDGARATDGRRATSVAAGRNSPATGLTYGGQRKKVADRRHLWGPSRRKRATTRPPEWFGTALGRQRSRCRHALLARDGTDRGQPQPEEVVSMSTPHRRGRMRGRGKAVFIAAVGALMAGALAVLVGPVPASAHPGNNAPLPPPREKTPGGSIRKSRSRPG